MKTSGDSPVHWCVWTRPDCRPENQCRCTVRAGRSKCSRSGCSGQRFPLQRPAGRAGEETRRWLLQQPSAQCIAVLGGRLSGSTQVTTGRQQVGMMREEVERWAFVCFTFHEKSIPILIFRWRSEILQQHTLLSFPPDASNWWSVLHLSPQTSCLCPWRRRSDWRGGALMSRCRMTRSRLPDDSWSAFHANAPDGRLNEAIFERERGSFHKYLYGNEWRL